MARRSEPDPWGGLSLGEVLSTGSRPIITGGAASGVLSPPLARASSSEDRPIRGRSTGYDLSFVDMENEWERVTEYAVVDEDSEEDGAEAAAELYLAFAGGEELSAAQRASLEEYVTKSDGLPPAVFLSLQAVSFVVACVDGVNKHVLSRLNKLDCDDALPSARGLAATLRPSSASKVPRKSPRCPAKLTGVECSVCLEHFEAEQPLFLLPCRHLFHQVCLAPWFKSHRKCPFCRAVVG